MASSSTKSGSTTENKNYTVGGSNSYTTSGSSSDTTSHTHTEGGSVSHSVGGSNTQTQGGSTAKSQSFGGNASYGSGKSWASGEVSDRTQQKYNEATQDYVRSQNVEDAYARLQGAMNSKPAFQSQYEDKLSEMYNRIMNREDFTYDFNKDAMYQQYKDQYLTQGKRAMQDTMGQLAATNSGYGSSYAQTAGQQTYQNYLEELMNKIPELRQQAREEYDREGDRLAQMYQLTNDAYNREYGQYRDTVGDWQNERSFQQSNYQDERNFDYNQAQNDRNFWQNEYWQEKNAEQSNVNANQGTNWNEGYQEGSNWSNSQSQNWQDTETRSWSDSDTHSHTDTSGWSNTASTNWSNSIGTSNTSGWSNTVGSGSGSGGSSGNAVQFSNENSMHGVFTGQQRQAVVDDVSELARAVNTAGSSGDKSKAESALTNYLRDLYKNGSTGTNGENVQYSVENLTSIYNRAITKDVLSNGSRNGAETLSTAEMARKLGIRLN